MTSPRRFMTPEIERLVSFQETPIRSDLCKSISNTATKFAAAGFSRPPNALDDVVQCKTCDATFRGWAGESPIAVHRVISPKCPFLNTPPSVVGGLRSVCLASVRRSLFPATTADSALPSERVIHTANTIRLPVRPLYGGYEMLFASHRLLTFQQISNPRSALLAENGFVYRVDTRGVMCIYCGLLLKINMHQPEQMHKTESPCCPFVSGLDVGNISREEERKIRLKYYQQQQNVVRSCHFIIKHPEYESVDKRRASFANWPLRQYPSALMSEAGFFFTNLADQLTCYCCGFAMRGWEQEDGPLDVWKQHAKISPTCLHVIAKGQQFVEEAQEIEVKVTVIRPEQRNGTVVSSNGCVGQHPGSFTLDPWAAERPLACGYTIERIRHAILKFFWLTGLYPNDETILSILRIEDENHLTVCKQRETISQNEKTIEEKDQALEMKERAVQQKEQEKRRAVQEKEQEKQRAVLQEREERLRTERIVELERQEKEALQAALQDTIQEKDNIIRTNLQVIEHNRQMVSHQTEQVALKELEVARKQHELDYRNRELAGTKQELAGTQQYIQQLLQKLQSLGEEIPPPPVNQPVAEPAVPEIDRPPVQDQQDEEANSLEDIPEVVQCKVCKTAKSNVLLMPCQHVCSCSNCVTTQHTLHPGQPWKCPYCRSSIQEIYPVSVV